MTPEKFAELMLVAWRERHRTPAHWFSYHFDIGPTPFARSILGACASIDKYAPNIGTDLLRELLSIGGIDRHEPHYEMLLQKLAETGCCAEWAATRASGEYAGC